MTKTNNFIELNGKRYDAISGAFLGKGTQPAMTARSAAIALKPVAQRGMAMDGIVPSHGMTHKTALAPKKPTVKHHVQPLAAHHPEHAKTLRRDVVKQPIITPKKPLKPQAPTDIIKQNPGVLAVMPKLSSQVVDPARASRALGVAHSPQVERFRKLRPQYGTHAAALSQPTHRPVESTSPNRITSRRAQPLHSPGEDDIFERAIAHATSHEQPAPKESRRQKARRASRRHKRSLSILTSVLLVVVLGSFIFWQNRADVELQLAAARSGVAASMPAYRPSGFAVKGLTYSPGTVTIGFHSPSNQNYSVVQKTSNWDSQTLLENYVATSGQPYNAYQAAGRTVYIYGNGNATWVNGGIWYQVNDNENLNKNQIIDLATSM